MKTSIIKTLTASILLCSCVSLCGEAQSLAQQGTSVQDIVPDGWIHQEAQGDLNKDGIPDLAVVATPDFKENLRTRDDGYVYNFNKPILAIYFGTGQGKLQLWKQYDNVLPADEDENCSHEIKMEITSRNTLRISVMLFCSMGSYDTTVDYFTYRYQHGDFYLIGFDSEELQRNKGDCTEISENYLTWKRQVKHYNVFFYDKQPTEKWTRIKKRSLEQLGSRELR